MNQLESALVITLRDKIPWESAVEIASGGTLTPVDPAVQFNALDYQARDRQLAFRDLTTAAAVIEASIRVSDVWGYRAPRPQMEGPARKELANNPAEQSFSGTHGTVRHVGNTSIPWDACRYADKDLYGRDAIIYQTLARAIQDTFVQEPPVIAIDLAGTIPQTSVWSISEGRPVRADINTALPLNRDLFKLPDQNLADRDNQLAGYVARVCQALKNPFEFANRIYVETAGADPREPEVYALASDDGVNRVWVGDPALPDRNRITYNVAARTLQWTRENLNSVHVPQICALSIPGIDPGQTLDTLPRVPDPKDAQYWRTKAEHIVPPGPAYTDELNLDFTATDQFTGGCTQATCASLTVPGALQARLPGDVVGGLHQVACLVLPDPLVEIMGAQNVVGTSGTLGGATFETGVSLVQAGVEYLVEGGSGIIYAGGTVQPGDIFHGQSGTTSFSSIDGATVRQAGVSWRLALPPGAWSVTLDYTNLSGSTTGFAVNAEYSRSSSMPIPVISEATPLPFTGANGDIVRSAPATFDVVDSGEFTFPVRWTGGDGQLHIRQLNFFSADHETGRYAMSGTFGAGVGYLDVTGQHYMPEVMLFDCQSGSQSNPAFLLNWTADASLPLRLLQVHVQLAGTNSPTPSVTGFEGWRQEATERAVSAVQTSFAMAVEAYGTNIPTFTVDGAWTPASTESWVSFIETAHPRLRELAVVDQIITGRQYQVTGAPVVYSSGTYALNEKFYGLDDVTVFSGAVKQVGAFQKAKAGHLGRPALVPDGVYFDAASGTVGTTRGPAQSVPQMASCLPWMIDLGFLVVQNEFVLPAQV